MATTLNKIDGKSKTKYWIIDGLDKDFIEYAPMFGEEINKGGLSTSQIRNFYGEVIKMRAYEWSVKIEQSFILLKPKLAYATKRANKQGLNDLKTILDEGIDAVLEGNIQQKQTRFENFCNLFEAIIAYHRANGGK